MFRTYSSQLTAGIHRRIFGGRYFGRGGIASVTAGSCRGSTGLVRRNRKTKGACGGTEGLCFLGDLMGEPVADKDLTLGDLLNSSNQLFHCPAFEDVTACSRLHSSQNVMVVAVDGQDNGARFRYRLLNSACSFDAVQVRH